MRRRLRTRRARHGERVRCGGTEAHRNPGQEGAEVSVSGRYARERYSRGV